MRQYRAGGIFENTARSRDPPAEAPPLAAGLNEPIGQRGAAFSQSGLMVAGSADARGDVGSDQGAQRIGGGRVEDALGGETDDRLHEIVRGRDHEPLGLQVDHIVCRVQAVAKRLNIRDLAAQLSPERRRVRRSHPRTAAAA